MLKIKKIILQKALQFLKSKAAKIAHPELKAFAERLIKDLEDFAEVMLSQDLTDAKTAKNIFDMQMALKISTPKNVDFRKALVEAPADVVPVYNDLPSPIKKRRKKNDSVEN